MPTAIYDASLITRQNRGKAIYAYYSTMNTNIAAGTPTIRKEQSQPPSAAIIVQRTVGGMAENLITRTGNTTTIDYPFRGSGGGGPTNGASPGQ